MLTLLAEAEPQYRSLARTKLYLKTCKIPFSARFLEVNRGPQSSLLPLSKWHDHLADPTLAAAIMHRITTNYQRIELKSTTLSSNKPQQKLKIAMFLETLPIASVWTEMGGLGSTDESESMHS
jgi:hypothetical protein